MNLNLQCLEILQMTKMTKMTSIINNYQDSYIQSAANRGCRIMIVKKSNLILEARYCGELVREICNSFYAYVPFSPLSRFMSI